jgi:hypothetical protein
MNFAPFLDKGIEALLVLAFFMFHSTVERSPTAAVGTFLIIYLVLLVLGYIIENSSPLSNARLCGYLARRSLEGR